MKSICLGLLTNKQKDMIEAYEILFVQPFSTKDVLNLITVQISLIWPTFQSYFLILTVQYLGVYE